MGKAGKKSTAPSGCGAQSIRSSRTGSTRCGSGWRGVGSRNGEDTWSGRVIRRPVGWRANSCTRSCRSRTGRSGSGPRAGCCEGSAGGQVSSGRRWQDSMDFRFTAFARLRTGICGSARSRMAQPAFTCALESWSGSVRTRSSGQIRIHVALRSRARLWAATDAGLFVATAPYQRFSRVTELPATQIWAIAEEAMGTIGPEAPAGCSCMRTGAGRISPATMG